MKCPSCGKEVSEGKNFCDFCGFSLFGPRSISLNVPNGNTNSIQSNNIQSITGIDINSISKNEINNVAAANTIRKEPKPIDKNKIIFLIMAIIIVILSVICIILFINKDDKNSNNQIINNSVNNTAPTNNTTVNNITYALTNNYSFVLPLNFIYSQDQVSTIVSDSESSIIIYNYENGKIDKATGDTIKKQYIALGYNDASVVENTLNSKKIIYINFTSNNMYFKDFYYQYDSNKYIYGQINANSNSKLGSENINTILSSLKIETSKNISINKQAINYENILLLFK